MPIDSKSTVQVSGACNLYVSIQSRPATGTGPGKGSGSETSGNPENKMSASPPPQTSTKRSLEEASSPSRAADQPDAKRPALDKIIRHDDESEVGETTVDVLDKNGDDDANGAKSEQADTVSTDVVGDVKAPGAPMAGAPSDSAINSAAAHDETSWIHIRAVISSPEAATIIGKGGENVSNIRKMSNAKCTVSDYQKGAVERILTVSGIVDAVAKVSLSRASFWFSFDVLMVLSGLWFDHPYAEQRTSWRSLDCLVQDVSSPRTYPSHSDRFHHRQGGRQDQRDSGGLRRASQCLGLVSAHVERAISGRHGCRRRRPHRDVLCRQHASGATQ